MFVKFEPNCFIEFGGKAPHWLANTVPCQSITPYQSVHEGFVLLFHRWQPEQMGKNYDAWRWQQVKINHTKYCVLRGK